MPLHFSHKFDTPIYKSTTFFPKGLFINGHFVDGSDSTTIEQVSKATFKPWTVHRRASILHGFKASGPFRADLMQKLANARVENRDKLYALEALDNDLPLFIDAMSYYAGWADKTEGKGIKTDEGRLTYTRREPIGAGQIIPFLMMVMKLGPALATVNCIVMKVQFTPLSALRICFPPGVVNVLTSYGETVGEAISMHMKIEKVAFTGSVLVSHKILVAAGKRNLKKVTLELGGKSPNIIFNDADLEQAINYWNHGQACCASSRLFVQSGIYDEFLKKFTEKSKAIKVGDPFDGDSFQGPMVSKRQFDRVMNFIDIGKMQGATVHLGGERHGAKGYFIQPAIFTNTTPDTGIVQEKIFGSISCIIKFEDEEVYGLAAAVFAKNITRALETVHNLKAGTGWVNCRNVCHANVPFGGYKQSGFGWEFSEYPLQK
ncbi:aldehyde dehydrogenase [Desarmillaria ectypa]|nr:aldehyde dehydrogenase [Desarmillaria ectypa]